MATAKRFEDLDVWQRSRELANLIYAFSKEGTFSRDFGLRDQIRRAAVSIMSNIAEGFDRGSNKEFIHFLTIARGSLAEVKSLSYAGLDIRLLSREQFVTLELRLVRVNGLLNGLIHYLKNYENKG